ncbi:MAG: peroxiredoxin [Oleiphilaceae bacterium]|jgi:peroxiredoxin
MTNLIKSIYISLYITLLSLVSIHAAIGLFDSGINSVWLGIAIGIWPALLFFVKLFAAPTARTSANLNTLIVTAFIGAILSFFLSQNTIQQAYAFAYGSGLGIGGLLLYIFWYSRLGRKENIALKTGKKLPKFELKTSAGVAWSSADLDQHPALILFFRGNWCPLCMAQIKEVAASYQALEKLGVSVFLVSPQPEKHTQALAKKFNVNYHFMVDEQNQAAGLLGIDAKHGTPKGMEVLGYDSDTVLPTAILTDQNGVILFTDQTDNYRVRPEPDTFLRVFTEHGLTSQH